jgi:ankyrin repeat protein
MLFLWLTCNPQNVLIASLSPVRVKLADFGISKTTVGTLLRTRVGSSGYLAPELQGLGPSTRHDSDVYTNAIDMWSMGCMVYKMFTVSKLPFMLEEDSYSASMSSFIPESGTGIQPSVNITLLLDFCRGTTDLPLGPLREADVSEKGIDFIKRLLAPDPRSRMKATAALGHKWFTEQEPKSLDELERIKAEIISLEKDPVKTESFVLAYREGGNSDTIHTILIAMGESPESLAHKASDKGYTLLLDMLLKVFMKSNDMLVSTFKGCTFLQTAVKRGHLPVVELLLTYGADLNAGPGDLCQGRTALQSAAEHGHLQLVTFLVQKGADIYSKPAQTGGLTALQAAASRGHLEILRYLIIEHKADVNEEPCKVNGRTALQAAAENGHIAAVDFLLRNGAKVNAAPCDQKGRTALQASAGNGHFTIVKMLLENSAEVNASPCSSFGRTALQAAAERGHSKVVRLLLESSADVNAEPCGKKGKTALWAAAEGGHFDVVRLLLESRADINCDRCGQTASEIAEENGHFDIAEFISEF